MTQPEPSVAVLEDPRGDTPPPAPHVAPGPRGNRRVAELSVVALLAAGLASGGTYAVTRGDLPGLGSTTQTLGAAAAPVVQGNGSAPDWTATAEGVASSVVAIDVSTRQGQGEGSGVLIDKSGHVLTNNHVVAGPGASPTVTVTLDDGRAFSATITGTDPATDLAVLTLQNPPGDLAPISIGDSDALAVGEPVMAVGNPLGLAGTVTTGIVSALNRPVSTGSADSARGTVGEPVVTNAIQTSAAINPGNSGGALVTADGRLVGINSSIATLGSSGGSGNIGIGFAIPSNEAKAIAEQLIATGSAEHAYLGVSPEDTTVADGASKRAAAGIRTVAPGTPAAAAGLRASDAVVAIDGERIDSSLGLVAAIREHQVGDTVTLTVLRDGQRTDVEVTLTARPSTER